MIGGPEHPFKEGDTVIVPLRTLVVVFVAINEGTLPNPFAAKPMEVLEFVQVNVAPEGVLVNVLDDTTVPLQTDTLGSGVAMGIGLTVTTIVYGDPIQPLKIGVMIMIELTGLDVEFIAVKGGMKPVPAGCNPIEGLELVQVYVAPAGIKDKNIFTNAPAQTGWLDVANTMGVGLTVIVKTSGTPTQEFKVGVTVTVEVTGPVVILDAKKAGVLPLPLAAKPMEVLEFVQAKVAPKGVLENVFNGTELFEQNERSSSGVTVGAGLTVMVKVSNGPGHPLLSGIMTMAEVIGFVVEFVAVNCGMKLNPTVGNPIAVFEFVHVYAAPAGIIVGNILTEAPAQTVWLETLTTKGIAFTFTVIALESPEHPFKVAVTL